MNNLFIKRAAFWLLLVPALTGCGNNKANRWTGVIEGESYAVASPVSERLLGLTVGEGDLVRQGDILGQIDTTTQKLQMESLESKMLQLELQEKDLANQLKAARESESFAVSTRNRYRSLGGQEAVSEQALDELDLKAEQASSTVRSLEIKKETLASQREDLSIQYRSLEETVSRAVLTAPSDGMVDKIYYNPGEYVPALRTVIEIVDMENLWCMIYVPEKLLPLIRTGTELTVRAGGETLTGTVVHINARAEFTPRELLTPDNRQAMAYGVKVRFLSDRGVLKIGMPVDLTFDAAGN